MKMIIKFVSTFKHIINLSACQSKNFKITKIGPCITTRSLQNIFSNRIKRNNAYYVNNDLIKTNFDFLNVIIDNWYPVD